MAPGQDAGASVDSFTDGVEDEIEGSTKLGTVDPRSFYLQRSEDSSDLGSTTKKSRQNFGRQKNTPNSKKRDHKGEDKERTFLLKNSSVEAARVNLKDSLVANQQSEQ